MIEAPDPTLLPVDPTLLPPGSAGFGLPPLPDDFGFGDEHALLRDSAQRFLAERCPTTKVRQLLDDATGFEPNVYREMARLGWLELGGESGPGHLHLGLLMEEMGRVLLPSPFLGSVLALVALRAGDVDQRARLVPAIVSGETIATVAWGEPGGGWEPGHVSARAEPDHEGYLLHGKKTHVLFAQAADLIIVPCREPGGSIALFAVEPSTPGLRIEPEIAVDATRRTARAILDGARVAESSRLEGDGLAAWNAVHVTGRALLAAEMLGAADAVLDLTRRYAIDRQQFGRAIGSFQAVKHPLVDVMIGVELGRSLALGACALLDQGTEKAEVASRMAKAMASDVLALAVKKGVQLHGGYGFTWDADIHLYFKRMLWSRGTLGDAPHHRKHLGARWFGW